MCSQPSFKCCHLSASPSDKHPNHLSLPICKITVQTFSSLLEIESSSCWPFVELKTNQNKYLPNQGNTKMQHQHYWYFGIFWYLASRQTNLRKISLFKMHRIRDNSKDLTKRNSLSTLSERDRVKSDFLLPMANNLLLWHKTSDY